MTYEGPQLTYLGSLTELTLGNGGSTIDGSCKNNDQLGEPSQNCTVNP